MHQPIESKNSIPPFSQGDWGSELISVSSGSELELKKSSRIEI
jgi:hypothetical protein